MKEETDLQSENSPYQLEALEAEKNENKNELLSAPFKNDIGEQNSYVNVVIQLFFHTPKFKDYILSLNIKNDKRYILLYKLQELIVKFSKLTTPEGITTFNEDERYCDVLELRKELEKMYMGEELFKLNQTGDPADLLFMFLNSIHSYSMKANSLKYSVDKQCDPICPSHEFAWLNLVRQFECKSCQATSDVLKYDYNFFIYEIEMREIFVKMEKINAYKDLYHKFFTFAKNILSKAGSSCPRKCQNSNVVKNTILMTQSEYIFIGISWKETNPKLVDICKYFFMLPRSFENSNIFQIYDRKLIKTFNIYGLICYWEGKYVSFFKLPSKEIGISDVPWIFQEDRKIVKLKNWKELIIHCIKNHFHPVLLFYSKSDSKASLYDSSQSLTEVDYNQLIRHSERVDTANELNEEELNNRNNKDGERKGIRPLYEVKKTGDEKLIKSIKNLQKMEQIKKKEERAFKEMQDEEDNIDILEGEKSKEITTRRGNGIIGMRPGEWKCNNPNCSNINNMSTYQCIRCKTINLKIYEAIEMKKQSNNSTRMKLDGSDVRFENLSKTYNLRMFGTTSNVKTSQTNKTENKKREIVQQKLNFNKNKRNKDTKKDKGKFEIFMINEDKTWKCPYCKYANEGDRDYCENCKRNQPHNEQRIHIRESVPIINGIKHYF